MISIYNVLTGAEQPALDTTRIVNCTAASLTVTRALHSGKIITLNLATGIALALPNATGTGAFYTFVNMTALSGSGHVFTRGVTADAMVGICAIGKGAGTSTTFLTASNSNTVTLNGTTTGGLGGDYIELVDIALNQWFINLTLWGSGTLATPFSNS